MLFVQQLLELWFHAKTSESFYSIEILLSNLWNALEEMNGFVGYCQYQTAIVYQQVIVSQCK